MGIRFEHQVGAGMVGAYAAGEAESRRRRQKYANVAMLENQRNQNRLAAAGLRYGNRRGARAQMPQGQWSDPLASSDTQHGMLANAAARKARDRKGRLGQPIPSEWQPSFTPQSELDRIESDNERRIRRDNIFMSPVPQHLQGTEDGKLLDSLERDIKSLLDNPEFDVDDPFVQQQIKAMQAERERIIKSNPRPNNDADNYNNSRARKRPDGSVYLVPSKPEPEYLQDAGQMPDGWQPQHEIQGNGGSRIVLGLVPGGAGKQINLIQMPNESDEAFADRWSNYGWVAKVEPGQGGDAGQGSDTKPGDEDIPGRMVDGEFVVDPDWAAAQDEKKQAKEQEREQGIAKKQEADDAIDKHKTDRQTFIDKRIDDLVKGDNTYKDARDQVHNEELPFWDEDHPAPQPYMPSDPGRAGVNMPSSGSASAAPMPGSPSLADDLALGTSLIDDLYGNYGPEETSGQLDYPVYMPPSDSADGWTGQGLDYATSQGITQSQSYSGIDVTKQGPTAKVTERQADLTRLSKKPKGKASQPEWKNTKPVERVDMAIEAARAGSPRAQEILRRKGISWE